MVELFRWGVIPCKINGIDEFQLQMHDGIVRGLTEVRYVLRMNKILSHSKSC